MPDNPDRQVLLRLQRENEFYKHECNELGARVHRAQEELSVAMREARRSWTVAKLMQEAYLLADYGGPEEASVEHVVLPLIVENAMCDKAMLLREHPADSGRFEIVCSLGVDVAPSAELAIPRAPGFLYTAGWAIREPPASDLISLIGAPHVLWGYDSQNGLAVLLANRQESNATRPFEPADEELTQAALAVYLNIKSRKEEQRRRLGASCEGMFVDPDSAIYRKWDGECVGIPESQIQQQLRAGGLIVSCFIVDRSGGGDPAFVAYFRGSWTQQFQILRTFRNKADRIYQDLNRLLRLAHLEFGFTLPLVTYRAGAPELGRFPGVCERDREPLVVGVKSAGAHRAPVPTVASSKPAKRERHRLKSDVHLPRGG